MNKNLQQVLVRREYNNQVWYEVISYSKYTENFSSKILELHNVKNTTSLEGTNHSRFDSRHSSKDHRSNS